MKYALDVNVALKWVLNEVDSDALFQKWQQWLRNELYEEFRKVAHDKVLFDAFLS